MDVAEERFEFGDALARLEHRGIDAAAPAIASKPDRALVKAPAPTAIIPPTSNTFAADAAVILALILTVPSPPGSRTARSSLSRVGIVRINPLWPVKSVFERSQISKRSASASRAAAMRSMSSNTPE